MESQSGSKINRLRWVLRISVLGIGISLGTAVGLSIYTFQYANGVSYLRNDPKACINCHIMREQYDGWINGSHRSVATCNDCHAPHDLFGKYSTKAINGLLHGWAFSTGRFHEPIQIKARNKTITEGACRHCHAAIVESIDPHGAHGSKLACLHCHQSVGHMH